MTAPRQLLTTVYVCGPMTGYDQLNYPAFARAAARLQADGRYIVLSPHTVDDGSGVIREWSWYMRRTLAMLLQADAVALLPGWKNSNGASLEVVVADALSMPCKDVEEWLK